ncbi:MAG: iron ABC transporter permease, partial [Acetatifactor sp.]|nr:iron ABC transporter permease [Acetatifactor sp.]
MSTKRTTQRQQRFWVIFLILILLFLGCALLSLSWGSFSINLSDIFRVLAGNGTKNQNTAIFGIRLPRIVMGILVAAALACAGCILQTETKNDLADPGIIGINAGGATAAVLFIQMQTQNYYSELGNLSIFLLPILAMLGALIAAAVIYLLSCRGGLRPRRLLLVGIGMNAGLNALITFFTYTGSVGEYNRVLTWISGSLWGSGWTYVQVLTPIVVILFCYVLYHHKTLDVMQFSDELVIGWGKNVNKER